MKKFFIIISGPTAVGKSDLAEELAVQIDGEIINADMGQMYTPLSIGTAKPEWEKSKVPHHLFDILDKPDYFTVTEYRERVIKLLEEIWQINHIPILVGGSLFYLQSLFFPPLSQKVDIKELDYGNKTSEVLWHKLYKVDFDRAQEIDKSDAYRIKRALDIWYATGIKPSTLKPVYNPPAPYFFYYLTRDKEELYARINKRTKLMLQEGWIEETKKVMSDEWGKFLYEKKIIGYDDIIDFLNGKQTNEDRRLLIHTIAKKTRHYAKRQMTFWRMLQEKLSEGIDKKNDTFSRVNLLNLSTLDVKTCIKELSKKIKKVMKKNGTKI